MSYVIAEPDAMLTAASDLAGIGSALDAAHAVAAHKTLAVAPAAADEVSVGIAALFAQHAQDFQARAGHAAAYQGQFAQNLAAGASSYAGVEGAITALLHEVKLVTAPFVDGAVHQVDLALFAGLVVVYDALPPSLIPAYFLLLLIAIGVIIASIETLSTIIQAVPGLPALLEFIAMA